MHLAPIYSVDSFGSATLGAVCSMPGGRPAYKPVADPESLLLPVPELQSLAPTPDPVPGASQFTHSLLLPGMDMTHAPDQGAAVTGKHSS